MALKRSDERSRPHLDAIFGIGDDTLFNRDRLPHKAMTRAVYEWPDERNALWPFCQA